MPTVASSAERQQRFVTDERTSLRVLEDVAHLRRRQPPVDRHGDGAEIVGGEHRLQELGAVVRRGGPPRHHGTDPASRPARRPARPPGRPSPDRSWPPLRRPSSPCRVCGWRGGPARRTSSRRPRPSAPPVLTRSSRQRTPVSTPDRGAAPRLHGQLVSPSMARVERNRRVSAQGELGGALPSDHRHLRGRVRPGRVPRHGDHRALRRERPRQGSALPLHRLQGGSARRHPRPGDGRGDGSAPTAWPRRAARRRTSSPCSATSSSTSSIATRITSGSSCTSSRRSPANGPTVPRTAPGVRAAGRGGPAGGCRLGGVP